MKYIVVDIDGTVSLPDHRLHLLDEEPIDWAAFYKACKDDAPNIPIINLVHLLSTRYSIVFCTGRSDIVKEETEVWLNNYNLSGMLLMRAEGDYRPDYEIKPELLSNAGILAHEVELVLEDRLSVVNKWRSLGWTCLQVANGDF